MNTRKHIHLLLAGTTALLALTACSGSSSEPQLMMSPNSIKYTGGGDFFDFMEGDSIGIYVYPQNLIIGGTNTANTEVINRKYSYRGGQWVSREGTSWPAIEDGEQMTITAYAPYRTNTADRQTLTCPALQTTERAIHYADFTWGTTTVTKSSTPVQLSMKHLLSLIKVNVSYTDGGSLNRVMVRAMNNAYVTMRTGEVSTYGSPINIQMGRISTTTAGFSETYACVVPPQNFVDRELSLTVGGITNTLKLNQNITSGNCYQINISVVGEKEVRLDNISVSPWTNTISITDHGKVSEDLYRKTGDVITYQKKRDNKPVTWVVIPEGFTLEQVNEGGLFETKAREAIDFVLDVEPIKTYKDYLNIYFITAISNEQGADSIASSGHPAHLHDTYFDAGWEYDGNYNMTANADSVFRFVQRYCPDVRSGKVSINDVAIFMIINDARYGGITWLYGNGRAFGMTPLTKGELTWAGNNPNKTGRSTGDWRNTFLHENVGHCFSKLTDEYWYNSSRYTSRTISQHSWTVPSALNVTADTTLTSTTRYWRHMINSRFPKMGNYEGAMGYAYGIWRSEEISCMIDNRRYFSAWQRWLISKRIHDLAGENFTYEQFLANDVNFDEILDGKSSSIIRQEVQEAENSGQKLYPLLPHPVLNP